MSITIDCTQESHIFRKKPVSISAINWTGKNFEAIKKFAGDNVALENGELIIKTLEDGDKAKAKHVASIGDFVLKGVHGEYYFCKPDIFDETYEFVE
jgi:hypothetical protein